MKISAVRTAKKYGDFVLREDGPNLINVRYLPEITREMRRDRSPRVYLFVVDGEIYKIGGSADKSGMDGTLGFYTSALQGSPGKPRFILHHLIARELESGHSVELYVIRSKPLIGEVSGLFATRSVSVHAFKEMEEECVRDYVSSEGRHPKWNFQENSESYPDDLSKLHNEYHERRLKGRSSN
jgi:hypothetical protein